MFYWPNFGFTHAKISYEKECVTLVHIKNKDIIEELLAKLFFKYRRGNSLDQTWKMDHQKKNINIHLYMLMPSTYIFIQNINIKL